MDQDRKIAWGFSLFADDLRAEIGGKTTLAGIYQADMIVQGTFPIVIPRFVVFISYYEIKDALDTDIVFKLTYGDDLELLAEVPVSRRDNLKAPSQAELGRESDETHSDDLERIFHLRVPIVLSPLMLTRAGRLRVRAHYSDGAILKLGSLRIRALTPEQFKDFLEEGAQAPPPLN